MRIYKTSNMIDSYIKDLPITENKSEANILLLGCDEFDPELFPRLEGVFRLGVGVDNVPFECFEKRRINYGEPSEKTKNIIYEETANFTCSLIFYMHYMGTHNMKKWIQYDRRYLKDLNLLIIGQGNIGKKIKKKMMEFINVDTFDMKINSDEELSDKINKADFITLNIPAEKNENFFNKEKIELMKDHSVLINTSRGVVVSEDDLYDALEKRKIYAAFDVFWKEPYEGKLMKFYPEKFYATPHVASTSNVLLESMTSDFRSFCNKTVDYFEFKFDDEIDFFIKLQDANRKFLYLMCVDEYKCLKDIIKKPEKILDFGCGMGRSSIFLKNMMGLESTSFYLCDFNKNTYRPDGESKGALGYHKNNRPVPFNSLGATKRFCDYNNLKKVEFIDLLSEEINKIDLVDVLYSFYSVGYHWDIDEAVEKYGLLNKVKDDGIFIFGVRKEEFNVNTSVSKYLKLIDRIQGNVYQDFAIYEKKN